jgi:hypothetical protein
LDRGNFDFQTRAFITAAKIPSDECPESFLAVFTSFFACLRARTYVVLNNPLSQLFLPVTFYSLILEKGVRVGGTMKPRGFEGDIQLDLPTPDFVPDSSPVVLLYDYRRNDYPKSVKGKMRPIGQLRDLREWIRDCRNTQRFLVSTLLVSILSVVVLNVTRSAPQSKEKSKRSSKSDVGDSLQLAPDPQRYLLFQLLTFDS